MKFTLSIILENDAMSTSDDVASALEGVAVKLRRPFVGVRNMPSGVIHDVNGNRVGEWRVFDGDES